ncbi:MAG TPA: DNA damage-inducible protein D [Allosphingosinicella sp.]|nr:DNA damage-inducible protein D [Allosphingosinicella sp.]
MNDRRKTEEPVKLDFDFEEAMARVAQTDPQEVAVLTAATMNDGAIERLIAAFEDAARSTEEGQEYWTGRDLARLLEYAEYRNFLTIVEKAKAACRATGVPPEDHFVDVTDMVEIGSGARREIENLHLSRYACYLIAQNADSRKRAVAFAQTYFAIQTRRQELADRQAVAVPMSEDEKRVFLRNQIREHNRHLSSAAKEAGVVSPQDFAIFHSSGYQGLYGKTVGQIRQYKGLTSNVDILDRMGSTELAANFFRVTQTEEKLRKDGIRGKQRAYDTHYAVGRQVRDAMLKISGTAPEDLPAADSIKLAERRLRDACPPQIAAKPAAKELPAPESDLKPINLRADLWKYALLIMAQKPSMEISTRDLIDELPRYIRVPEWTTAENNSRTDSKFSQIVRNLKSHKASSTNFIFQGYAEDIKGGFRATAKGLAFVRDYFEDCLEDRN